MNCNFTVSKNVEIETTYKSRDITIQDSLYPKGFFVWVIISHELGETILANIQTGEIIKIDAKIRLRKKDSGQPKNYYWQGQRWKFLCLTFKKSNSL